VSAWGRRAFGARHNVAIGASAAGEACRTVYDVVGLGHISFISSPFSCAETPRVFTLGVSISKMATAGAVSDLVQ
jgi:hypothetical protein